MRRTCLTKTTRALAGPLTGLLFSILVVPLGAATAPKTTPVGGFGPFYDAAHETTLTGTIQEVVTRHTPGSPAGMHLLVLGPQGVVDAHVGAFLSKQNREAMKVGMPVEIVGANVQLHGRQYLLARQITVGGHVITVRSARGAPVFQSPQRQRIVKVRGKVVASSQGGAR
ncbi:MAG TPA: hypothetical protein VMU61_12525 [Candidatus Aquilonibacter sp.]|nr:hypothetical protein [Candidatus Aquilonibacter sp.]